MLKQLVALLFLMSLLVSCSYFEKKLERKPIQEVDTIVDFSTVDAFPLFPNCKDIPSRRKQQICFQLEMSQYIYAFLKQFKLNAKEKVNDTVLVKLKVNILGETSLSSIQISKETKELLPNLDSLIKTSLQSLPTLQPAIKRNMPVTTEFTLPIILKN
ncbi:hypothetical protein Lupro_11485 [Lutibacter profundi]|uniref:TonB C-terminal domain-containing protein n=1 Tax=Lutibacter profundi TaxID=1622118 RepID=A0A0X8G856_9FLAO|nr:hypothetical protein [Lutibacter profundi]AMC11848.1 hypothetical protein Lupro_11485 [Lutibacter profundi]